MLSTCGDNCPPLFQKISIQQIITALGFRYECDVRVINRELVFPYEVIISGRAVFVRDEDDRIDFETRVLVEYQDIKFMYDLFDREYLAQA